MERENYEFFKLDEIDRKVLFWLIDHVKAPAIHSWLEFIAADYKRRKTIVIDVKKVLEEMK